VALPGYDNAGAATIVTQFYDASEGTLDAYDPSEVTGDRYDVQFTDNGGTLEVSIINRSTLEVVVPAQAYVSGDSYDFQGLRVTITDSGAGPQAGDSYVLEANKGLAANLAVNSDLTDDQRKIAAAKPEGAEPFAVGDNRNALAIADLRFETTTILARTGTLSDIFEFGLVSEAGSDAAEANTLYEYSQALYQQIENMRDSVAGVSLDEEMTNIIKFQHAYSAAARLISLADELLQTILDTRR
jgi:flagellar hook-associated protein FlgK